ncbi:auxin response factor 13 [Lolium perenne]|uniref:auxin response factor 13 n=1 Tax=Lolium perenne TaxID=4522 RepID=UPI0021F5DCE0|nr:auxin response factor 13-like [Lolium perenne]
MALPPAAAAAALADPLMAQDIWMACAGPFARLPSAGTKVYYFPKGHADQCRGHNLPVVPADTAVPCTVESVVLHYHPVSDSPYAVISLHHGEGPAQPPAAPAPALAPAPPQFPDLHYYVKHMEGTSDDRRLVVPKPCADELFYPPLLPLVPHPPGQPYPNQDMDIVTVQGDTISFKHFLQNGSNTLRQPWSDYYQSKGLKMGKGKDGVVLMRCAEGQGGLLIGFRRGEPSTDLASELIDNFQAASAAAGAVPSSQLVLGQVHNAPADPFTVHYYPRQGWPFVVPRTEVDDRLRFDWEQGLKVRMEVPVDNHEMQASRDKAGAPSYFHGDITAVNNDGRWCQLQVNWEESSAPTPSENVNTWQVQLFAPPVRKRKPTDPLHAPSSSGTGPSRLVLHDIA